MDKKLESFLKILEDISEPEIRTIGAILFMLSNSDEEARARILQYCVSWHNDETKGV